MQTYMHLPIGCGRGFWRETVEILRLRCGRALLATASLGMTRQDGLCPNLRSCRHQVHYVIQYLRRAPKFLHAHAFVIAMLR